MYLTLGIPRFLGLGLLIFDGREPEKTLTWKEEVKSTPL